MKPQAFLIVATITVIWLSGCLKSGRTPDFPDPFVFCLEKHNAVKVILRASLRVDDEVLNEIEPGLGDHFRSQFSAGVALKVQGLRSKNNSILTRGKYLTEQWGEYWNDLLEKKRSR